jgi:exodeoxyribonuclease VII small subunit
MSEIKMSYKEALAEIEKIVEKIENEELDVDELSVMVKRAGELLQWCKKKLKATEEELNLTMEDLD